MIQAISVTTEQFPPWPISDLGASAVSGDPQGAGRVAFETPDKVASAGTWSCSPGSFDLEYAADEIIYVIEGSVTVSQEGGPDVHLLAGDFCYFPRGTKARWMIHQTVRKVFFGKAGD